MAFTEPSLNAPEEEKVPAKGEIDPEIQKILNEISGSQEENQSKSEDKLQTENNYSLEHMAISLVVEGSYDQILNLLRKIEYFNKKILIGSLNLISNGSDLISGTITLDIYAIPKLQIKDDEYFTWKSLFEYGKENPFEPFGSYVPYKINNGSSLPSNEEGAESDSTAPKKVYDFRAIIKPISSDLPAFIIGDAKERNNKSYLYADNPNNENVEFNVFEKDSKYYYRYKTSNNSYPKDYDNELVEFIPYNNTIEVSIDSQYRNDNTDVNGINITIINNTDLAINVDIKNDDSKRPRVNISKVQGNVKINR
jgi:type IV pilus assembly protein PilO